MTLKTFFCPAIFMGSVLISGCSLMQSKAGPNSSAGWINKFYSATEIQNLSSECLALLNQSAIATDQFVQVNEPHGRRSVYILAHVPNGLEVKIGDEVEIEPRRCQNGVIPEVKRVFK